MNEKPILFNTEMVRAILDGRKTQTRRPLKPQPASGDIFFYNTERHPRTFAAMHADYHAPFFKDDELYVRETWAPLMFAPTMPSGKYVYRADCRDSDDNLWPSIMGNRDRVIWHPSIHMPKEAARIWLRVKSVAVQRIPDISEEEAKAEGVFPVGSSFKVAFWELWKKLYGYNTKWAWVIEFERVKR